VIGVLLLKAALLRAATGFEKVDTAERDDKLSTRTQREIFIGSYAIRKMMTTFKIFISMNKLPAILKCHKVIKVNAAICVMKTKLMN